MDGKPAFYDSTIGLVVNLPDGTDLVILVDRLHQKAFSKADLVRIAHNAIFGAKPADRASWVPASQAVPH